MLITSSGRNTLKPTAAARPTPSAIESARSPPAMPGTLSMSATNRAPFPGCRENCRRRASAAVALVILRAAMIAFVRELSPQLERCELSFLKRVAIDAARARQQHAGYVAALEALGCEVQWLPPLAEHADGVFVEDTAVMLPELTVLTRPGAASRRGEVAS